MATELSKLKLQHREAIAISECLSYLEPIAAANSFSKVAYFISMARNAMKEADTALQQQIALASVASGPKSKAQ